MSFTNLLNSKADNFKDNIYLKPADSWLRISVGHTFQKSRGTRQYLKKKIFKVL